MEQTLKILSIDDDEHIRFALQAVIESQGWEALTAGDIYGGIEIIEAEHPNLILIDYHMPRVNGLEGVRMIREKDDEVPIIVFTIDESQELADQFLMAGASDFAMKPIRTPDIISRIKLHIRLMNIKARSNAAVKNSRQTAADQENSQEASQEAEQPAVVTVKGIGIATLELIKEALASFDDYETVEAISEESGLAYQTTYRYLQYLSSEGIVDIKSVYGKVGRPKQFYKLAE
ncbi:response regulator [Fusibacter paucivorans]|uniref:Stage 0 sporulation protein A homolog n=1 Tax=Fusibacter paucivorans TaxID=76009 RepID=A0ABS5PMB2_9FIRM|nr:response regulator [Fusibacter paucivorans]MBS7525182.1 response regulator [Fusibacter paucivorans]